MVKGGPSWASLGWRRACGFTATHFPFHSHLPYDVSPEQALGHPEVQRRLDISLRHLLATADKFLSAITSSVDQIP